MHTSGNKLPFQQKYDHLCQLFFTSTKTITVAPSNVYPKTVMTIDDENDDIFILINQN